MSRTRALAGLAGACVAALAGGAPAAAAQRVPAHVATVPDLHSEPRFGGDGLVWLESSTSRYAVRTTGQGTGTTTLTAGRLDSGGDDRGAAYDGADFDVSAGRLVLHRGTEIFAKGVLASSRAQLSAGPLGGSLSELEFCFDHSGWGFELDGNVLAEAVCGGPIKIRDLATGAPPVEVGPGERAEVNGVQIAGRYVAFGLRTSEPPPRGVQEQVVVYDRETQAVAYSVPFPDSSLLTDFDVAPDGTLAAVWWAPGRAVPVSVHTPAQPDGHVLPVRTRPMDVRMVGGRLVLALEGTGGRLTLAVTDLAGRVEEHLADLGAPGAVAGGIDFDGARVAYALRTCDGRAELRLATLGQTGVLVRERLPCPFRIRSRRARVERSGATIRIACPLGCSGRAQLARRGRRVGSKRFSLLASARSHAVRIALERPARRLMRARRRLTTKLTVVVRDRALRGSAKARAVVLTRPGGDQSRLARSA